MDFIIINWDKIILGLMWATIAVATLAFIYGLYKLIRKKSTLGSYVLLGFSIFCFAIIYFIGFENIKFSLQSFL